MDASSNATAHRDLPRRLWAGMQEVATALNAGEDAGGAAEAVRAVAVARLVAVERGGSVADQAEAHRLLLSACPEAWRALGCASDGAVFGIPFRGRPLRGTGRSVEERRADRAWHMGRAFRALLDLGLERACPGSGVLLFQTPSGRCPAPPMPVDHWVRLSRSDRLSWLVAHTGRRRSKLNRLLAENPRSGFESSLLAAPGRIAPGAWFVRRGVRDRALGAHYTPMEVVDEVVERTLQPLVARCRTAEQLLDLRICDPAVGAGGFLIGAWRLLVGALIHRAPERWSREEAATAIAVGNLFGADLDPLAVGMTRLVLATLAGVCPSHGFGGRIVHGDALVGMSSDDVEIVIAETTAATPDGAAGASSIDRVRLADAWIQRIASRESGRLDLRTWIRRSCARPPPTIVLLALAPLHWEEVFGDVFQRPRGGFDAVLTNPPYRSALSVSSSEGRRRRQLLKFLHPEFTRGAFDLSTVFWSRITRTLLHRGGRYGAVVPTASLSSMARWQEWMHQHWRPDALVLYPVDCFVDARVRTSAVIGGAGRAASVHVEDRTGVDPMVGSVAWDRIDGPWFAATRLHRAASPPRLPTFLLADSVEISAGCATDVAYRLSECLVDGADADGMRMVTTGSLDRFVCHWGTRSQRFLGQDLLHPRWPSEAPRPAIERARDRQLGPKILVAGLTAVMEAWFDAEGRAAGVVQTWVLRPTAAIDPYVLVGILNSSVFSQLYMGRYGGASMSGRQTTIKKRALLAMPLPTASRGGLGSTWTGGWRELWDARTPDAQLRKLLASLARRLQRRLPPADEATIDAALHAVVARMYGHSEAQAWGSYRWWLERMRASVPEKSWSVAALDEVVRSVGCARRSEAPILERGGR